MDYHSDLTRSTKEGGTGQVGIVMIWCVDTAGWCERTGNTQDDDVLPSDSFRKACEKVGSTRLESFWNQWVTGSGCPRFDVFQRFNKKKLCVEMTVRQTQDIAAAKIRPIDKNDFWRDVREDEPVMCIRT